MKTILAVLTALQYFLKVRAHREEAEALRARESLRYQIHDRYEIQKQRIRSLIKERHDAVGRGADPNELRLFDYDIDTEQSYFRTLGDQLQGWDDLPDRDE